MNPDLLDVDEFPTILEVTADPRYQSLESYEEKQAVMGKYFEQAESLFPESKEFRPAVESILKLEHDAGEAAPVTRRFIDARLEDEKFALSLDRGLRSRELDRASAESLIAERTEKNKARDANFSAISKLYDPEAGQETAKAFSELEEKARSAGKFVSGRFSDQIKDTFGLNDQSAEERMGSYDNTRDAIAKSYGLKPEELDDVIKHRLDAQTEPVSRDALGQIHIKNDVLFLGEEEIKKAIQESNLPAGVKRKEVEQLSGRLSQFKTNLVDSTVKNFPELAKEYGVQPDNIDKSFENLKSALNGGALEQGAGGISVGIGNTAKSILHAGGLFEEKLRGGSFRNVGKPYLEERAEEIDRRLKINEATNALSSEFNKEKVKLWGSDAAVIGQGVYSIGESAALAALTGPLAPEISAARIASLGKTGQRLATAFNAASKVAPTSGILGARQGFDVYEEALKRGVSDDEAQRLAWTSGVIETATTMAFSAAGAGGIEDIATGAGRAALRKSLNESAKSTWGAGAKAFVGGTLGELAEEETINLLDSALVQTKLNPNMTVDDFQQSVKDTAIATLLPSSILSGVHARNAAEDVRASNESKAISDLSIEELRAQADALLEKETSAETEPVMTVAGATGLNGDEGTLDDQPMPSGSDTGGLPSADLSAVPPPSAPFEPAAPVSGQSDEEIVVPTNQEASIESVESPTETTPTPEGVSEVDLIENHFRPGNEVTGSDGETDRVVSFQREGDDWSVTVQKTGDESAATVTHSIAPEAAELQKSWSQRPTNEPASQPVAPSEAAEVTKKVPANKVRKPRSGKAVPLHVEIFSGNPIVATILENGGLVSKSRGKKVLGDRYEANSSLWDDSDPIKKPSYNFLYSRDGGRLPDQAAQDLYDAGLLREPTATALWQAIGSAVTGATKQASGMRVEEQRMKQAEDFAESIDPEGGGEPVAMSELVAGDKLDIDGELVVVESVKFDEDGYVTEAVLQDGSRFDRQVIEGDQVIYVEKIDRVERIDDDFLAGEDTDFDLETQTDEQIKAEEQATRQKALIQERQDRRLTGSSGDLTADMFGEGDTPLFNERRAEAPFNTPRGGPEKPAEPDETPQPVANSERQSSLDRLQWRTAETLDEAKAAARDFVNLPLTNLDDNSVVTVSGKSIGKMTSGKAVIKSISAKAHAFAVANLDSLFRFAIRSHSKPDERGSEHISAVHRYYAPFPHNGETVLAKLTVKEFNEPSDGSRVYSVEAVDIVKPAGKWTSKISEDPQSVPQAGFEEKLQQRIDSVKRAGEPSPATGPTLRSAAAEPESIDDIFDSPRNAPSAPVKLPLMQQAQPRFGDPISAPEVIDSLKGVLKVLSASVPIRVGRIRGRALGQYWPKQKMIRLLTANDISTAAHEVAHAIEDAMFGPGRVWSSMVGLPKPAHRELHSMGKALYGSTRPAAGYDGEGFAEFFRMLIEGGIAHVQQHAPDFTKWFEANMMKPNPEFAKAVNASIESARRWNAQGSLNRAKQSIAATPSRVTRVLEAGQRFFTSLPSQFVDMAFPLKNFVRAAEERAGAVIPPAQNPWETLNARRLAHESITAYMVEKGMIDFAGNKVGKSLAEVFAPVRGKQDDFMVYLWARRTIALAPSDRNSGLALADAEEVIRTLDSPAFRIAAQGVYDWNDGVLNYAAQASPDYANVVQLIRAADPGNYIPLLREFKAVDERYRGLAGGAKSGSLVNKLKGSGRRIKNPAESMISQARALILKSHQKAVLDQIIRIADAVPGLGDMVFEVQPDKIPGATRAAESVLNDLAQALKANGASKEMNDALKSAKQQLGMEKVDVTEALLTFWVPAQTPKKSGEDPMIPIFNNGQRRWFEVNRDVYDAINGMKQFQLPPVLDLFLGVPTRTLRLGTTGLRASFSLITNPLRDFRTLHLNSQANANTRELFFEWMRGMGDGLLDILTSGAIRSEWLDLFDRLGGGMATPLGQDMLSTTRATNRLFAGRLVRTIDPRNWLDFLREILQFPEKASRIAELKLVARDMGWNPPMPLTPEIAAKLINAAKQVTTDFTAAGSVGRALNQVMPFFNAQIQGPRAHVRAIQRNPRKFALRGLEATAIALALWFRYKDEEWWTEMPESERYRFTYIPFETLDGKKELIRIPRSFEADGIFMAGAQALADAWYQKEPERAAKWFGQFLGAFQPSPPPPIKDTFEQAANRNFHSDRPIVPEAEKGLPADEQFDAYTTTMAIKLGELTGISPRRIDHSIRSYFGGTGTDLASVFGRGTTDNRSAREGELADIPVIGTLFQRGGQSARGSESMSELYERLDMATKRQRSRKHTETADERQSRLMLQDAVKAVAFVSDVSRLKWSVNDRRGFEKMRAEIAREAVKAFDSNADERSKFQAWKKKWEKQAEKEKRTSAVAK